MTCASFASGRRERCGSLGSVGLFMWIYGGAECLFGVGLGCLPIGQVAYSGSITFG